jgi:hypothetical protein
MHRYKVAVIKPSERLDGCFDATVSWLGGGCRTRQFPTVAQAETWAIDAEPIEDMEPCEACSHPFHADELEVQIVTGFRYCRACMKRQKEVRETYDELRNWR